MNRGTDLILVTTRLRLDGERNDRLDPLYPRIDDGMSFISHQRFPGLSFFQFRNCGNVTSVKLWNCCLCLSLKQHDRSKTFGDTLVDVVRLQFGRKSSRIHTVKRNSPGERIRKCLEHKCRERLTVRYLSLNFFVVAIFARNRAARSCVGKQVQDGIQKRLDTDVAGGRSIE